MRRDELTAKGLLIVDASTEEEVQTISSLFQEYAAWLNIDLSFQKFDEELANLPGDYAPPDGRLLLAAYEAEVAGCVALRRFDVSDCEMKRMWVRPKFRGLGVGYLLAERLIAEARGIGYERMLLDSIPALRDALRLYRSLGFQERSPYRYNPEPDAVFMQLNLAPLK